jgi:hypothetical protein
MMQFDEPASSDIYRLSRRRRDGRSKMMTKKTPKKSKKKSGHRTAKTAKNLAAETAAGKRTSKVERGTSGTGPRINGASGGAKKPKGKPCD